MKFGKQKRIYFDHAASTPVLPEVVRAMEPYWTRAFAHPWSLHTEGREAREVLGDARAKVADFINARPDELLFTSSGTHSNAQALKGALDPFFERGEEVHVVVSAIEHPSVGGVIEYVRSHGGEVDILPTTPEGIVDITELPKRLKKETRLVSVMYVNSEIGTIQPIKKIARVIRKHMNDVHSSVLFHTDATQAALYLPIDVRALGVDLLTIDAHKMYGPKGVSALFVRRGVTLGPIFFGSSNDMSEKGTPPVPLIVGFARCVEIAMEKRDERYKSTRHLQDVLIDEINRRFPQARINGSRTERIPNNVSISFHQTDHEYLHVLLDKKGFAVATRSACLEEGEEGSYVIASLSDSEDRNAIRVTFGDDNTKRDIRRFLKGLATILPLARTH